MSNATYRPFVEKLGATDSLDFVGDKGEIFWDPENGDINLSDGKTPGGTGIKTRSLTLTSRYVDQFQWVRTFANENNFKYDSNADYGSGIAVDSDGYGYTIGGNDNDGYPFILKFDTEGNWDNGIYLGDSGYVGEAIAIHKDAENGDVLYALTSNNSPYLYLTKLDTSLSIDWSKELSGSGLRGGDVTTDAAGNVYVVGWSSQDTPGNTIIVAKFSPTGNLEYVRSVGDYGGGRAWGVSVDQNDLYIVGRTTDSGEGGADIFVVKLNCEDGSTIWQRTLGTYDSYTWEYGYGISVGKEGVYITADARNPISNQHSVFVAKLSKAGTLVWQKFAGSIYYDSNLGNCIVTDEYDNVYISGMSPEPNIDVGLNGDTHADLLLLKFDKNGDIQYQKAIGQTGDDYSWYYNSTHNLAIDGEFLWITGYSYLRSQDNAIGFTIRVTTDGDNEGVYGEYLVQPTSLEVGDAVLVFGDANLDNIPSNISVSGGSVYDDGFDNYQTTLSFRAPFELNVPNGTITAKVVRTKQIKLGDIPIKATHNSNPYYWEGHNLYIGQDAGYSTQDSAYHNIVIGKYSGVHNTTGSNNIFLGKDSGYYNTTGYSNVFIGRGSGNSNSIGDYNVAIGNYSGDNLNEGSHNVVIGDTNVVDGNDDYQLAIGSNGDWWLRGDSARSVYINTNLIFDQSATQIVMKSPNGSSWSVQVDNSGNLTATAV